MKSILKRIARKLGIIPAGQTVSTSYQVIDRQTAVGDGFDGWQSQSVAERQDAAYRRLLQAMYQGEPRADFKVAVEALRTTGLHNPELLEIGCGSGYYSEVLPHLLGEPIRYTGLDYSEAMIELARRHYPAIPFLVGDAVALPFQDGAFDVVMNGAALMHIVQYERAIAESSRVSRGWCIFHTVTVHQQRPTTFLKKNAYGAPTAEVSFNEADLLRLFQANGLVLQKVFGSITYDLHEHLGEPTASRTFLCRKAE